MIGNQFVVKNKAGYRVNVAVIDKIQCVDTVKAQGYHRGSNNSISITNEVPCVIDKYLVKDNAGNVFIITPDQIISQLPF